MALVKQAIDRLRLLAGVVDASMARDDAWRFLELGRHVERLQQQIVLLDVWDRIGRRGNDGGSMSWADLLRVCGAFEPYRRDRSLALRRGAVLGFLIRSPEVARSLRFATDRIDGLLRGIDPIGARHPLAAPHRLVLRMAASLEMDLATDEPEAEAVSIFETLTGGSRELYEVLLETYVDYPVTTGLPS
ncbi:alpha-E domain-containing protein [Candidatus Palauibacter sp.]|uniref:alpha-E domain-containing protein n=1 Tax=Candidatus Palauibacter sp. TaxID=3101350 RepID=UPI003CC5C593